MKNQFKNRTSQLFAAGFLSLALTVGVGGLALAPANAAEIVVAQDTTAPVAAAFTATPSAPGALKIHAAPKSTVSVKTLTKSKKNSSKTVTTKKVTTNKNGDALITGLTPGVKYTVHSGTDRITAIPESNALPATSLRVVTTEIPGQLELRWQHQVTAAQGAVGYTVTATPQNETARQSGQVIAETTATSIVLTDLDLDARYEFAVTAHNTISTSTATKAVMSKSLRDLTGTTAPATPVVEQQRTTPATPAPAPQPSGPTTRTIYICPDTFTDVAGVCQKTAAYTYTNMDYTYHTETYTVSVQKPGAAYAADTAQSTGTPCPWGGSLNAEGDLCLMPPTTETETRTRQVQDATPAGYTDTGSHWTKKDAIPAGYTDDGTQWVQTTAKIAKEVPA